MTHNETIDHYNVVWNAFNRLNESGMHNAADALLPQLEELSAELDEFDFWK